MDFAEAYLLTKLGHPELAGWWGKLLGGWAIDDGGDLHFDALTWDQVIASTKTGKYKTFAEGATKELDLGAGGIVNMQIIGIDEDDLAYGSGKAPLSLLSKELLKTPRRINPAKAPESAPYNIGTGSVGGWGLCEARQYLTESILPLIPRNIRSKIRPVIKISNGYGTDGVKIANQKIVDTIWLPSHREVLGGSSIETEGVVYAYLSGNSGNRKKTIVGSTTIASWWTRSAVNLSNFRSINTSGSYASTETATELRFPIGFCL
jgi:hypothetical protein